MPAEAPPPGLALDRAARARRATLLTRHGWTGVERPEMPPPGDGAGAPARDRSLRRHARRLATLTLVRGQR